MLVDKNYSRWAKSSPKSDIMMDQNTQGRSMKKVSNMAKAEFTTQIPMFSQAYFLTVIASRGKSSTIMEMSMKDKLKMGSTMARAY